MAVPRKLHCCWFGSEAPKQVCDLIDTWAELHPTWELLRWTDTSVFEHIPYFRKALTLGRWANASNFVRLWVLQHYGGVYLDTDYKLFQPLDNFIDLDCFLGFEGTDSDPGGSVVNNAILGAAANHPFIAECLERLLHEFDGTEDACESSPQLTTKILKENWDLTEYGYQSLRSGLKVFPKETFYPVHWSEAYKLRDFVPSDDNVGVHLWNRSWLTREVLLNLLDLKDEQICNLKAQLNTLNVALTSTRQSTDPKDPMPFAMKTKQSPPDPETPSSDSHSESHRSSWEEGVTSEVSFWRSWLTQKGGEWRSDYESRLDPTTPLRADICHYLPEGSSPVSVLDVGSGPITNVGYRLNGREVAVTATDPLAEHYATLLNEANVTPPVITQRADAEHLTRHFPENHFDLVHSRNALDHTYNPLEAIRQMLRVCKRGGHVYIIVYRNEGILERYEGLHQWNFDEHQGKILTFSRKAARYLDEYIDQPYTFTMGFAYSDPSLTMPPRAMLTIIIKKR